MVNMPKLPGMGGKEMGKRRAVERVTIPTGLCLPGERGLALCRASCDGILQATLLWELFRAIVDSTFPFSSTSPWGQCFCWPGCSAWVEAAIGLSGAATPKLQDTGS